MRKVWSDEVWEDYLYWQTQVKPYIYGKTLIRKWVGTLVVHPLFCALIAWVMSLILK